MEWLRRDLRVALRLLLKDRAFSLAAILTLTLCFAANIALFSVVHNVLLRPLPTPDSDRIVLMANAYPGAGATDAVVENSGVPDYFDRIRETNVYEAQALVRPSSVSLDQGGVPTRVLALGVTPSYFQVLRVQAAAGRTLLPDESEVGNEKKVVLADSMWRSQFAADPSAVGRDVRLDGDVYTIVGVAPRSLEALNREISFYRPLAFTAEDRSDQNRHSNSYHHIARLKPGATIEQAQAQIDALNRANLDRFPEYKEAIVNAGFHTVVKGWQTHMTRQVKPTLLLLWGGALFVLLIGCVNVANLVLVRARARLKEMATRLALGAGNGQLVRQLLVEGWLLALTAAAGGLLVGYGALQAVGTTAVENLPYGAQIGLDGTVLLYAMALVLVVGTIIGIIPLAGVRRLALSGVLREEGRTSTVGRGARRMRRGLVAAQVAFTFVLLVGAGLLGASLRKVLEVDPGFNPARVLTASVLLPKSRYADNAAVLAFADEALRRVRAIPGVVTAGITDTIPFGSAQNDSVILAEGYAMKPGESLISPHYVDASAGYFEAIGARLVHGRWFAESDTGDSLKVAIVDRKLAERFWPGQDPLGRRLYKPTDLNNIAAITEKTVFWTVVGVIEDLNLHDLTGAGQPVGTYYFPVAQDEFGRYLGFALRTSGSPEVVTGGLRAAIAALDRELPVYDVKTMEQRVDAALIGRRSPAILSFGFAATALVLSAIGIYGVLAYLVLQRKKEIGIRMALGSTTSAIFELVLREGALLIGIGLLAGAAGALALRKTLEAELFGVRATDPWVVLSVTAVLAGVALAACALPARRASRIDPSTVLSE
jgi:predicted permease